MKTKSVICQISLAVVLFLGVVSASAQNAPPAEKNETQAQAADARIGRSTVTTRIYHVKNADPSDIERALSPAVKSGQVSMASSTTFRTLTLTGQPQALDVIESLIRELDVPRPPQKAVEIVGYLLVASDSPSGDQKLPAALDPVVKQLRATFQYSSYQLLDTALIRNRSGRGGRTSSEISLPGIPAQPANFAIDYGLCELSRDDRGNLFRLSGLQVSVAKPRPPDLAGNAATPTLMSLSTNIDLREGQMTVVGKSSFELGSKAFIVVFNGKVLD